MRKTFRRIRHIQWHFDDNLTYPARAPQDTQVTQVGSVCHVAVRLHPSVVAPKYTHRKHADGYTRRSPTALVPAQVRIPTGEGPGDEHTHRVLADTSAAAVWQSGFPHNTIKHANADKSKEGGKK